MKTIVPIFLEHALDAAAFEMRLEQCLGLLAELRGQADGPQTEIIIVTSIDEFPELEGIHSKFCTDPLGTKQKHLPYGTRAAVEHLIKSEIIAESEVVAIVDYRSTRLGAQALQDAMISHEAGGGRPLVSSSLIDDNPCQWIDPYQMEQMDMICLLEETIPSTPESLHPTCRTRPFPFDWGFMGWPNHQEARVRESDYLRVDDHHARRSIAREDRGAPPTREITGVSALFRLDDATACLVPDELDEGNLLFLSERLLHDRAQVRLWQFASQRGLEGPPIELDATRLADGARQRVDAFGTTFRGPYARLNDLCDGFVLLVLGRAEGHSADLGETLYLSDDLWRVDPESGRAVDAVTQKLVIGRQQFPPVCAPDGELTIGRASELTALIDFESSVRLRL